MSLSARLNVDMLLYLLRFLDPVDQCNLVLSGVLKGYENSSQFGSLTMIKNFFIHVKLRYCFSSQQMEIWSLSYQFNNRFERNILKNMAKAGYLTPVRQLDLYFNRTSAENGFTLEDLANMFDFSPNLTDLSIRIDMMCPVIRAVRMTRFEGMASKLKKGFGRLERVELENCLRCLFLGSWSVCQEILTWCGECKELVVRENAVHTRSVFTSFFRSWRKVDPSWIPSDPDLSLVPADPGFGQKLQKLNFLIGPNETLKWLVPFYTNLHTLYNNPTFEPSSLGANDVLKLTNLRTLSINIRNSRELEEILRNCSQLKCLKVQFLYYLNEFEFADLFIQPADNIVDLELTWISDPFIEGALTIFKTWRYLSRLTLKVKKLDIDDQAEWPLLNFICQFILDMKSLKYLQIGYSSGGEMEKMTFEKIVNDRVKAHRPDFVFEFFFRKSLFSV